MRTRTSCLTIAGKSITSSKFLQSHMKEAIKFGIVLSFSRISLIESRTMAMTFLTQTNMIGGKIRIKKIQLRSIVQSEEK